MMHIIPGNVSKMVTDRATITILIKYAVTYGLQLSHLDFMLAHSNGQGQWQGHAHFDYEYL